MNGPAIYRTQPATEPTMHHTGPAACVDCGRKPARYLTIDAGDKNYQPRCSQHAAAYAAAHGLQLHSKAKTINIKTAKAPRSKRQKEGTN
jgi:hypothetical protein